MSRPLYYMAVATDYDGTLAHDGIVDEATVAALRRVREASLRTLLVTGRELPSLFATFQHAALFDRIVAENGAVVYDPAAETNKRLAEPPPASLLDRLEDAGVPMSVGVSIVATVEPYERVLLDAIRDLGLEWHVIFNKGSVMALPSGVTKATGLAVALTDLELTPARTIGIGDAENDHAFLHACGLSVAVANALPALKHTARIVTGGARGAGVIEIVDRLLSGDLPQA